MDTADGRTRNWIRWSTLFLWIIGCLLFACGCSGAAEPESILVGDLKTVGGEQKKWESVAVDRLTAVSLQVCNGQEDLSGSRTAVLQAFVSSPVQAQTEKIRFQPIFDIDVCGSDMTGNLQFSNQVASTLDIVVLLCISDAELIKAGYDLVACGIRTEEELEIPDYCEKDAYTVLFRSVKIQIGESLEQCVLSALPNGALLAEGDYRMVLRVDSYQPQTGEKSVVSAANETVVHIHS